MAILEQVIEILGQIIGFFFAYHLLRLAYKLFTKNRFAGAVFAAWAAAFVLLCSMHWFQVWAKSFIATNITSKLTDFGQQLGTVQATAKETHNQLASQQTEIDLQRQEFEQVQSNLWYAETNVMTMQAATTEMIKQLAGHAAEIDGNRQAWDQVQGKIRDAETNFINQQSLITNQFQQILALQLELAGVRTNLSVQGKKLSEVENWMKNLYGVMTNDTTRSQGTNFSR